MTVVRMIRRKNDHEQNDTELKTGGKLTSCQNDRASIRLRKKLCLLFATSPAQQWLVFS